MISNEETKLEHKRIKIELRKGNYRSYYVDANGLLKGEWGGFKEDYGVGKNGEHIYGVYYSRVYKYFGVNVCHSEWIPIDEFGYFYNRFDCRKYDCIYRIKEEKLYISVKNDRLGLIDENENILLHTVYNNIVDYLSDNLCIVTTETGKFIYNITARKMSQEYEDIFFGLDEDGIDSERHFFFRLNGKYGIVDVNGKVILPAKYEYNTYGRGRPSLKYLYQGCKFGVFVSDGLLYGSIPIDKYDNCFRVGSKDILSYYDSCYYITESKGKYGLLSNKKKCIKEPCFNEIILFKSNAGLCKISYGDARINKYGVVIFVIARKENKYWLYDAISEKCILDNCDDIRYNDRWLRDPYIEFEKDSKHGYVTGGGVVLSFADYDNIILNRNNIYIEKNGKKGVLNIYGYELLPCVYDSIKEIKGIYCDEYIVVKDGKEETVSFDTQQNFNNYYVEEPQHYERYAGSYAQDEMGYSDEDIDTIFDGDPDAYWNID